MTFNSLGALLILRTTLAAAAIGGAALLVNSGVTGDVASTDKTAPDSVHEVKVKTIDDKDFDLRKLQGRVLVFVNVASK